MMASIRAIFALLIVAEIALGCLCCSSALNAEEAKTTTEMKEPSPEMKHIARLKVDNELMRRHWTSWVTGKELREISADAAKEIKQQLEIHSDVRLLVPEDTTQPRRLSEFEERAVEDIRAGVAEAWHQDGDTIEYVRGMRATRTCLKCHHPLESPGTELQEGDLLGIFRVTLRR